MVQPKNGCCGYLLFLPSNDVIAYA